MALTDVKIRQAKAAGRALKLTDSNGLYLEVRPSGAKLWRYRYRIAGKENVFAIGAYPAVSLQQARQARDEARSLVKQGIHPAHARQAQIMHQTAANTTTFEAVAREWLDRNRDRWTAYYHRQATRCLEQNAFPRIGRMPIRHVTAAHILDVLRDMERRGAHTYAIQMRQWCSAVFRHAIVTLRADSDPAAALKGAIQRPKINHSRPMSAEDLADFKRSLARYGGHRTTVIALWLLLYTFVRTVELRKAKWSEIDLDRREWRIPADRMKMRRTHIVPLARQSIALLNELCLITGACAWLFPNMRRPGDAMSATTINRALEHMGYPPGCWTGHDFRATASTRLHEMGFKPEVIERQLAHAETNRTRAAYNHAEYLDERREMMQSWADYLDGLKASAD
jgi:integrase